jgi:hypothetical protein
MNAGRTDKVNGSPHKGLQSAHIEPLSLVFTRHCKYAIQELVNDGGPLDSSCRGSESIQNGPGQLAGRRQRFLAEPSALKSQLHNLGHNMVGVIHEAARYVFETSVSHRPNQKLGAPRVSSSREDDGLLVRNGTPLLCQCLDERHHAGP